MDHVAPPSRGERVRQAARDAGILPSDPLGPVIEALADIPAEVERRIADMRAGLSEVLEQAKKAAGGQLAAAVAEELPEAIDRLVVQRYWLICVAGAVLIAAALVGGYRWGSNAAAQRYANLPAEFDVAMTNHDAAKWLDMMRKNPRGAFDRCTDVPQVSGRACSFVLWTEPAQAAQ
jgi:hypothetical protein